MRKIKGNLIHLAEQGEFDVLVQPCNCFCTMGAGFALQIKKSFPEAFAVDCKTAKGDKAKLGTYSKVDLKIDMPGLPHRRHQLTIVNAYTQYHWRGQGVLADYKAIESVFGRISQDFRPGLRIGIPKIGAGHARGHWPTIEKIIDEQMAGKDLTLVEFV